MKSNELIQLLKDNGLNGKGYWFDKVSLNFKENGVQKSYRVTSKPVLTMNQAGFIMGQFTGGYTQIVLTKSFKSYSGEEFINHSDDRNLESVKFDNIKNANISFYDKEGKKRIIYLKDKVKTK